MIVMIACVTAAVSSILAMLLYNTYHGTNSSLSTAKVGEVYNFEYLQPVKNVPKRFLVKVEKVQTLSDNDISNLNSKSKYRRYDTEFVRTSNLVTGRSADGTVRNFYAERVVNCKRPLLGNALFKAGLAHLFC